MKFAALTLLAACAPHLAASSLIYGSDFHAGLVKINSTSGHLEPVVPEHPEELQGQQLATIDSNRERFYIIGYNATTSKPNLFGWDIKAKNVCVDRELELSESGFVGVGQAIDADPVTGDLFVVGRTSSELPNSTRHSLMRLYANSSFAKKKHIAYLEGIDVLDGSSAYDSINGIEYVAMIATGTPPKIEFNIIGVDVENGHIKTIKQDATHGHMIQNLDFDEKTGRLYGFGVDIKQSPPQRALMYLEPKADKFELVADVPKIFYMQNGNLVTLDRKERVYYALIAEGKAPTVTPWKDSDKCTGCKGSDEKCCYDPLQGPSSYCCFAVDNCSKITDGGGPPDLHVPFRLFGMHVDTGVLVSRSPPVCALQTNGTYPSCPWSIESAQ